MTSMTSRLESVPEISVKNDASFQMPLLSDPGNINSVAQTEKLGFAIRLGASLARSQSYEERTVRQHLSLSAGHISGESTDGSVTPAAISPRPYHTPRDGRTKHGRQSVGATPRSNREGRRASMARQPVNIYITCDELPLVRIRRIFNTVKIIAGVCLALKRYVKMCDTRSWSFMEMYLHLKADINQVVAFDPHSFARIEPERLRLKKLLALPRERRSVHDIKVVLALLRDNTSFQEYPVHVQYQLAQCMEYQSYEARRVVLKQGHRPEAFYIVLSGSLIANVEEVTPSTGRPFVRTVQQMGAGDTFGESALVEGGRRTATIVCKTGVELLVIMKHDFDRIIRAPLVRQVDDHIEFCRSMPLFQDFPCDKLAENPSHFFYHYFKKGDIVVQDSKDFKYIIIVKVGKCRVVTSYDERSNRPTVRSEIIQKDLEGAFQSYVTLQKITGNQRTPLSETEKVKEAICLGLLTGNINRTRLADHGSTLYRPKTTIPRISETPPVPPPVKRSRTLNNFFESVEKSRKTAIETDDQLMAEIRGNFWAKRLQHTLKVDRQRSSGSGRRSSGRSVSSRRSLRVASTSTQGRKVFAELAELPSGAVFGLESLVQVPTTRLSLISDGAECIFISKRLFLDMASIKVIRIVTDLVQTYPSRDDIEEQVRNFRKWQSYKSRLVKSVLDRRR